MKEKGYRAFGLSVLVLMAVCMLFQVSALAEEKGTTSGMSAKVYESMNEKGAVVANLIKGNMFTILSTETDENETEWCFICTDIGTEGYVLKSEIALITETTDSMLQQQIEFLKNVNIREFPSTDSEIVGRVPAHTVLMPLQLEENEDGEAWYQINYDGVTGYIKETTVDIKEIEPEEENVDEDPQEPEQVENLAPEEISNHPTTQENKEYTTPAFEKDKQEIKWENVKKEATNTETTRRTVNPIDRVVIVLGICMILGLLSVFFFAHKIQKIRKKRRKRRLYK